MIASRIMWKLPLRLRKRWGYVDLKDLPNLKLYERLAFSRGRFAPVQSDYRVVFEADLDSSAGILVPDPHWMAAALSGGILPPVEVYHRLETDENGRIVNGHILHDTPPLGPLSEEQAIEYLIQKDLPRHVWAGRQGNALRFKICKKHHLPASRAWRDAWQLNQEGIAA